MAAVPRVAAAAATDERWPDDAREVATIGEAWGVKGWFKVHAYASPPEALRAAPAWHLLPAERMLRPAAFPALLRIRALRDHADALVASAVGIDDRDGAGILRGARVFVARAAFPEPAEGEFYWADLIGLAVVNRAGEALGEVAGLIENGPQSVLRVRAAVAVAGVGAADVERLIPFVAAHVDSVDLDGRRIVVDWGLDY